MLAGAMDGTTTSERRTDARTPGTYERKTLPLADLKAAGDGLGPGEFRALVAVFGNIDSTGDRIRPGAFARTLRPPPEGRGLPPIVWAHDWDTPPIGTTLAAEETDRGLELHGRLLVADDEDHPQARAVYAAMKAQGGDGRPPLREFSFGFRVLESEWVTEQVDDLEVEVRELIDIELFEAGPVLVGANSATRLDQIKSATAPPVTDGNARRPHPPPALPATAAVAPRHL